MDAAREYGRVVFGHDAGVDQRAEQVGDGFDGQTVGVFLDLGQGRAGLKAAQQVGEGRSAQS